MKILLYSGITVIVAIVLSIIALSLASRKPVESGPLNGQLRPCPATPNCVCSEWPGLSASIEPLHYSIAHDDAWQSARLAITSSGGEIIREQEQYLHARYITPFMRFVDDVELRLDENLHVIHIRSASRVGHSDLGANRRRIESIRSLFEQQSPAQDSRY